MYAHLLAIAAREWDEDPEGPEFVQCVRRCRAEVSSAGEALGDPLLRLATGLRYDGALIALCASVGIETSTSQFSPPIAERRRLERELASRGIDLSVPSASWRRAVDLGGVAPGAASNPEERGAARRGATSST